MPATKWFASSGRGASVWRRENASRRWVSAVARLVAVCAHAQIAVDVGQPALAKPLAQQFQAAGDPRQQVVEVMRDPARQLADRLHLLGLAQRFLALLQRARPLLDTILQLLGENPQLLLGRLRRGDVVDDAAEAQRAAVGIAA